MAIAFAKGWFGDLRRFEHPASPRARRSYLHNLVADARRQPADLFYFYYDSRLWSAEAATAGQEVLARLSESCDNVLPVDLGDVSTREAKSRFSENALFCIDRLAALPQVHYGYLWDVVRLAHLEARDEAVPMDTDVELIGEITTEYLAHICSSEKQYLSYCLPRPNQQNAIMFCLRSQRPAVVAAMASVRRYLESLDAGVLGSSVRVEMCLLSALRPLARSLSEYVPILSQFARELPDGPGRWKIGQHASWILSLPRVVDRAAGDRAVKSIVALARGAGLDATSAADWRTLIFERTIAGRPARLLPQHVVEECLQRCASSLAALCGKCGSDPVDATRDESAALFLIASRINDAIFRKTCLSLLDTLCAEEAPIDRDSERILLFQIASRLARRQGWAAYADLLHVLEMPYSRLRSKYYLDEADLAGRICVQSHQSWYA